MQIICSICIENITEPVSLTCGHVFDKTCIQCHFDVTTLCPLCKYDCHNDSFKTLYLSTVDPEKEKEEAKALHETSLNITDEHMFLIHLIEDLETKLAIRASSVEETRTYNTLSYDLTKYVNEIDSKKAQIQTRYQHALKTVSEYNRRCSISPDISKMDNLKQDLKNLFKEIHTQYNKQKTQLYIARKTSRLIDKKLNKFDSLIVQIEKKATE
ncbi:uncharacterized protein BX663DRAFT_488182 [Cokeromyces recurvatus]|uniref:uncharacterized protein n=1 Tax=Cokeromyces recurvatus TaxID=90255 RepID=UPI002220DBF5|nr:uncharacterized protein BX663DRAFT_488182 [Cokeromyces recurvatus]KAI7900552.1 hypothetical protein BX663DRAFT_488182 [Cokeromyces recurvatus]